MVELQVQDNYRQGFFLRESQPPSVTTQSVSHSASDSPQSSNGAPESVPDILLTEAVGAEPEVWTDNESWKSGRVSSEKDSGYGLVTSRDEQWKRVSVTDLEILNDQRAKQMIASIKSLDKIVKNMRSPNTNGSDSPVLHASPSLSPLCDDDVKEEQAREEASINMLSLLSTIDTMEKQEKLEAITKEEKEACPGPGLGTLDEVLKNLNVSTRSLPMLPYEDSLPFDDRVSYDGRVEYGHNGLCRSYTDIRPSSVYSLSTNTMYGSNSLNRSTTSMESLPVTRDDYARARMKKTLPRIPVTKQSVSSPISERDEAYSPPWCVIGVYPKYPVPDHCRACGHNVTSRVSYKACKGTYAVSAGICLLGGVLGCFLIPFTSKRFKDINHYCTKCENLLGTRHAFKQIKKKKYKKKGKISFLDRK